MLYLVKDFFIPQFHSGSLCSHVFFNCDFGNWCIWALSIPDFCLFNDRQVEVLIPSIFRS